MPTSHGDYLDRAVSSLAKEMNLAVPVELSNSLAIHVRTLAYWIINSNWLQVLLYCQQVKIEGIIWNG